MRTLTSVAAVIVAVVLAHASIAGQGGPVQASAPSRAIVNVDDLMMDIERYRGRVVTVRGVVSAVAPDTRILSVIDVREFAECRVTTCARLTLPVRWSGTMPAVGDYARVSGEVQVEQDGKLAFVATSVESRRARRRGPR